MPFQSKLTAIKDSVGVARELAIIIAVTIIVVHPGVVAQWAKSLNDESRKAGAKSTEINVGPAKIAFDNTAEQVSVLDAAIKANDVVKKGAQLFINTADTQQKMERAKEVQQNAESVGSKLQASISSAKTALLAQDQIIQDAPGQASGPGTYAIVVSADKQEDLAAYEVQQLKKRGNPDLAIYDRQGFLRTTARFRDKEAAEKELPAIQRYRKTAYIINLDKWCTHPQELKRTISGAPVFACQMTDS